MKRAASSHINACHRRRIGGMRTHHFMRNQRIINARGIIQMFQKRRQRILTHLSRSITIRQTRNTGIILVVQKCRDQRPNGTFPLATTTQIDPWNLTQRRLCRSIRLRTAKNDPHRRILFLEVLRNANHCQILITATVKRNNTGIA